MPFSNKITHYLNGLKAQNLYRTRNTIPSSSSSLQFNSSDYLSLTQDKKLSKAYQKGYELYACGSSGSPTVSGYHAIHKDLEDAFAQFLSVDACLFFPTGYSANLAILQLLAKLNVNCLIDKSVHASIYDGIQLSKVKFMRYSHNNLEHFSQQLARLPENTAVITESLFSMSGQLSPLSAMVERCPNIPILVDEAHSFGVLGSQGRGFVHDNNLNQNQIPLRIIPLSKAFAGQGAIVAGDSSWMDALLQSARSWIYSTAASPALAYGLLSTLEIIQGADERRAKLANLVTFFKQQILNTSLDWADSPSHIQQLRLSDPSKALYYAQALKKENIYCTAMRYPTVSHQNTGLRIILNYQHNPEDILHFLEVLERVNYEA